MDTLRTDILGFYGHHREPLPTVAAWAQRGVVFERAYATSSWTVPSLASLLTSLYPTSHGAIHGIRRTEGIHGQATVPLQATTLAEALRPLGFTTFAVTSNPHLGPQFGFQRGFQRYANLNRDDASQVIDSLLHWRRDLERAPKVFLWLHFFDPHLPFRPRPEHLAGLRPGLSGARLEETLALVKDLRQTFAPADDEPAARFRDFRLDVEALYESDVALVEDQLQRLFQELPRFRDGLICFTADHGEEFLEHGYLGHGFNLHEETVRVPLVLVHPALTPGRRILQPFSHLDLAPTLLTLAGGDPPESWHGRDAFTADGRWRGAPSPVISEVSRFELKKPQASLMTGNLKLIATGDEPRSGGNPLASPTRLELYDLATDPAEKRDLSRSAAGETERLFRRLLEHLGAAPKMAGKPERLVLSNETLKALKALGYLQ